MLLHDLRLDGAPTTLDSEGEVEDDVEEDAEDVEEGVSTFRTAEVLATANFVAMTFEDEVEEVDFSMEVDEEAVSLPPQKVMSRFTCS